MQGPICNIHNMVVKLIYEVSYVVVRGVKRPTYSLRIKHQVYIHEVVY